MTGEDAWSTSRTWSFPASTASVGEARQRVATFLAASPFDHADDDVRLMVSELTTNAVVHAASAFEVTVCWNDGRLRVEVADGSERPPEVQPPTLTEANGRGLFIVQALAHRWGVDHRRAGKIVWFELLRRDDETPAARCS
ncbi:MAG: ATP-binding protein [Acidimicrobiales bacterium]|nr:ATP-binding protein [Acidimicrobiales bacterium]